MNLSFGQSSSKDKIYTQTDFEKNKIFNETYSFWDKDRKNWFSVSADTSKISYFVDARNYKGIVNYGVTFRTKTFRNFNFFEHLSMCFLKVEISKCSYNPKDSIADIEGFVSGNNEWGANVLIKTKREKEYVEIFLGEKINTTKICYLGQTVNKDSVEVKLNSKEANEFTVLDTFPAFYFKKKYSHYKTVLGNRFPFKISGKVNRNSLLAFGSSYSEIFDIGAMIYDSEKNKRNKIIRRENYDCIPLITANKRVADIEKEKVQKQEINYYTYTQNAENYILGRQFGKAKEEYNVLAQKYPILFARDIHNAMRCAILSRDYKNAFWWGEKLALKGIELPYFNSKIFAVLRKNAEWKSFSVKYDSVSKNAQYKWNLNLKKELTDLLDEDQAEYGLENRKSPKVLYETTEKVTGKLIDLLKKEGYPSEEKIGSLVVRDTVLIPFPDFNVLILHAIQQTPKNSKDLNELLDKSTINLEYDQKRSFNNTIGYGSCFRIYKGNLYSSKSCGRTNDAEVRKIAFKFNNPNGFITDYGNYVVEAHDSKDEKLVDEDYKKKYNLIMKLTDDWAFYDKY
ncbi:hypothetical protein [Flavobacterium sp. UGB4466]|uniref:hypothetical protein n=1 Tax=Flavobacterium sp. UGB4466 TaxID=2730889 RepID=UPI001ED8C8F3|nr:hypothetical protein [Flavobacterium sp. UGB4466]